MGREHAAARADTPEYSKEQVLSELEDILASPLFSQAPVLSSLLEYLVKQTLAGQGGVLKEYCVGVEVLGRGPSFDPRADTIVRVQARRLRARLDEYYKGPGQSHSIRFTIPKGHYAVHFAACVETPVLSAPDPSASRTSERGWIPAPLTRLIGREQEVAELTEFLSSGHLRLLTLTGPGGSGKTRLALEIARLVSARFEGGSYFAAMSSITEAEGAIVTLARVFGLNHTGGKSLLEALRDYLRLALHGPALLVVDNFEQIVSAAPTLVSLLEASPHLKLMVTSRAALRVPGEREYPVPPLRLPSLDDLPPVGILAQNPSVSLFVERAIAVHPGFTLNQNNAAAVAGICSRLDGLPLAIELAAARTRVLSPSDLLARFRSPLDLPCPPAQTLPSRQQTLRNTIEWSYRLLTPAEQRLFRRLSVFAGGCSMEAAEAVCNTSQDLELGLIDLMDSLAAKSLLQPRNISTSRARFFMLETIREYALEQLRFSGEEVRVRTAHAAYCLVLAEEDHSALSRSEQQALLDLCDSEHSNVTSAIDWLSARGSDWALRLVNAFFWYWERREQLPEACVRLKSVVNNSSSCQPTPHLARATELVAAASICLGDYDAAYSGHKRALLLYRQFKNYHGVAHQLDSMGAACRARGDLRGAVYWYRHCLRAYRALQMPVEVAAALSNLGNSLHAQGQCAKARALLHESLALFASAGHGVSVAWVLNCLGDVSLDTGDLPQARDHYLKALDLFRSDDDRWGVGRCLTDLGYLALQENNLSAARVAFRQSIDAFLTLEHRRGIAKALEGVACLALREGRFDRALTIAGATAGLRQRIGAPLRAAEQSRLDGALNAAWQAYRPSYAEDLWTSGRKLQLDAVVRLALS